MNVSVCVAVQGALWDNRLSIAGLFADSSDGFTIYRAISDVVTVQTNLAVDRECKRVWLYCLLLVCGVAGDHACDGAS